VRTIVIVFFVALLVRLLALAYFLPKLNPDVDLDSYRSLGRSLAAGRGFVAPSPDGPVLPNVARTPVYPLFIAGLIQVGGDRLGLFLAMQCVLGAATCALTVVLARRWLSPAAAAAAGLLVAFDPNSVVRCVDLRTETLFTLLLVAGAVALLRRTKDRRSWLTAGVLWSLAALTRPIAVWLWLLVLPVAFVWRARPAGVLVFLAGYLVVLGVWTGRNAILTGRPFVSTIATYNLLMYRAAAMEAQHTGTTLETVQTRWREQLGDLLWFHDRAGFEDQLRQYRQTARQVIGSDPMLASRQVAAGVGKSLFGPGARSLAGSLREPSSSLVWWPRLYAAALVVAFGLAAFGAWGLRREALLPVALALYFLLLAGGPEANSRFRTPITPVLAVLAVAAFTRTEKR
jgi:4-amino-4-deoxy-L-arabinose transferase-like glycosyltransferase